MVIACACISTIKDNFEDALVSIIQHCPNLEIFIVEQLLKGAFGPVADTLKTYASRRLPTVHWNVTGDAFPKIIWALDSLSSRYRAYRYRNSCIIRSSTILGSASDLPPSPKQLATTPITGFHNRVFRVICGVGHALCDFFHQLGHQPI